MRQSEPYTVGRAVAQIRRFEADEATGTQTGTVPGDVYTVKAMIMGPRRWPSRAWLQTPVEDVHDTQIERQPAVATEDGFFDPLVVDDDSASVLCLLDSIRRMLPEATDAWEAQLREAQIGSIGYSRQITSINASIPIAQSARISKKQEYVRQLLTSTQHPARQAMSLSGLHGFGPVHPSTLTLGELDVVTRSFVVYTQAVCDDLTSQWSKKLYDFGIELGLAEGDLLMQVWWINKVLEKYLVSVRVLALGLSLSGLCPTPSLSVLVQDHGYSLVELVRGYTPEDRRPNKTLYPRRVTAPTDFCNQLSRQDYLRGGCNGIQFNPFGAVPKKGMNPSIEVRLIHDPSYPRVVMTSRRIDECAAKYPGVHVYIMKGDIKSVFRLSGGWSGVYPSATPLSSICPRRWDDSPPYFMQYSVEPYPDCLVERSLARSPDTEPFFPYEWVDDYVPVEGDKPTHLSATATTLRLAILSVLGLRAINKNYFSLLSTHLDVLGLGFDTELQTASIPTAKMNKDL
ncbi:hypothetical protein GN958_ATG04640 [Phytophthora infestans]|uniref:Uncharacterized protein n=1 Tax=Phytophthora infestans TaxID=4787 RepID=A0A8S9UYJ0_PHYIN|nr:hypothetical protein GN958_ATG04640 [Phytophthora infestans]